MTINETSLKVANYLLQIKAIKLQPKNPFQWASGWNSPIYCDNRKILSYPDIRTYIRNKLTELVKFKFPETEVIAGVATGGIAIGALVAEQLDLPFVYVRSSTKGHGLQNQIEGEIGENQKVTVIEDLISTGNSSLNAVEALRSGNHHVLGMTAIFTYGFDISKDNFKKNECELHTLCNYDVMLEEALKMNYISAEELEIIKPWRHNPSKWGV